jgi:hypothetical protein
VRREYKVLRFEFQDVKDATGKRVQIDLTPSSKETVQLMNNLAKEGFEVREVVQVQKGERSPGTFAITRRHSIKLFLQEPDVILSTIPSLFAHRGCRARRRLGRATSLRFPDEPRHPPRGSRVWHGGAPVGVGSQT